MPNTEKHHHHPGLVAIGTFKLLKAIFFSGVGLGAIHFLHKDLGDWLLNLVTEHNFDPERHFVGVLLTAVDNISPHRMKMISLASFGYSGLALTEGVGLLLEKVWAEYLTLILSLLFLPWEMYELVVHYNHWRVVVLVINIAVVVYLLWFIRKARELRSRVRG